MRRWIIATLLAGILGVAGACSDDQPTTPTTTPPTQTGSWRGLTIAPENRCSPYDSDDYRYPQSVEDDIVRDLGGIYSPYTCETFDSDTQTDIEHIVARSEAHDSGLCSADDATRTGFARDLLNLTLASPSLNRSQKSDKDAAEWMPDQKPLLVRADHRGRPAGVRADYRSGRGGRHRPDAGGLHVHRDLLQLAQSGTHRPVGALSGCGPPVPSRWRANGLLQIPLRRLSDAPGVVEDVAHLVDRHKLLLLVRVEEPEPFLSRVEVQSADRLPVCIV